MIQVFNRPRYLSLNEYEGAALEYRIAVYKFRPSLDECSIIMPFDLVAPREVLPKNWIFV